MPLGSTLDRAEALLDSVYLSVQSAEGDSHLHAPEENADQPGQGNDELGRHGLTGSPPT